MRKLAIAMLCIGGIAVIALFRISPPHYFVINVGSDFKSANMRINDQPPFELPGIAGVFVARTSAEGADLITLRRQSGADAICRISYFTSNEINETHYPNIDDCDGKWH